MGKQDRDGDRDRIDAAFNRVLAAEAQARLHLEACRQEAAALIAAAEARARAIRERTDRHLGRAHRTADAGVARARAALLPDPAPPDPPDGVAAPDAGLDRAIAALVDEILGPPPGAAP